MGRIFHQSRPCHRTTRTNGEPVSAVRPSELSALAGSRREEAQPQFPLLAGRTRHLPVAPGGSGKDCRGGPAGPRARRRCHPLRPHRAGHRNGCASERSRPVRHSLSRNLRRHRFRECQPLRSGFQGGDLVRADTLAVSATDHRSRQQLSLRRDILRRFAARREEAGRNSRRTLAARARDAGGRHIAADSGSWPAQHRLCLSFRYNDRHGDGMGIERRPECRVRRGDAATADSLYVFCPSGHSGICDPHA